MLTNTAIEAMAVGAMLRDDRVRGLQIRRNAGGWSWLLYYRNRLDEERRPRLGPYPELSISKAREVAKELLGQVAAGKDPAAMWAAEKRQPTMDELWLRVEKDRYNDDSKDWHRKAKAYYKDVISPRLGDRRVPTIEYEDVDQLHTSLSDSPASANHVVAVISVMLDQAERWKIRTLGTNPCRLIERYTIRKRTRYATEDELPRLAERFERNAIENPRRLPAITFLYLVLFTGARPMEIAGAVPSQLERFETDGKVYGLLRLDRHKTAEDTGEQRVVHVPAQALALLDRLPADRRSLTGLTTVPGRIWREIRKEIGANDLWARDLRRTFGTVALSNGVSLSQVGELLGHASVQTTKIYAKLMHEQGKAASGVTANAIEGLMKKA